MTQLTPQQQMEMNRIAQLSQFNSKLLYAIEELSAKLDEQAKVINRLEKEVKKLNKDE